MYLLITGRKKILRSTLISYDSSFSGKFQKFQYFRFKISIAFNYWIIRLISYFHITIVTPEKSHIEIFAETKSPLKEQLRILSRIGRNIICLMFHTQLRSSVLFFFSPFFSCISIPEENGSNIFIVSEMFLSKYCDPTWFFYLRFLSYNLCAWCVAFPIMVMNVVKKFV